MPMTADAAFSLIQFDIDGLNIDAGGAFGGFTHSGQLTISADANSVLASIIVDAAPVTTSATLSSVSGFIDLSFGTVVGGQFSVALNDGSLYTATILAGSGAVAPQAGQGFQMTGLSFSGTFAGSTFGGVDVSGLSAVDGQFILQSYGPNSAGVDVDSTLNVFALPAPGSLMVLLGAGALCAVRRRR